MFVFKKTAVSSATNIAIRENADMKPIKKAKTASIPPLNTMQPSSPMRMQEHSHNGNGAVTPMPPTDISRLEEDRLITPTAAAKMLSLSRRTVDTYASAGRLHKTKLSLGGQALIRNRLRNVGGAVRFRLSEIKEMMEGKR